MHTSLEMANWVEMNHEESWHYDFTDAHLLFRMALWGTARGATGRSLNISLFRAHKYGSLCRSLYWGYRTSSTPHSSSYTLFWTWMTREWKRGLLNVSLYTSRSVAYFMKPISVATQINVILVWANSVFWVQEDGLYFSCVTNSGSNPELRL